MNHQPKMMQSTPTLIGDHVRLEALGVQHAEGLAAAAAADPTLYRLSPVPQGLSKFREYIDTALSWREAGTALPFATVRLSDEEIIGSTRLWNVEYWPWPETHRGSDTRTPDACEIGYTWLTQSAIRTTANTEAKLLMLTFAFEQWKVLRVCFHADARNARSRTAIERLGAKPEGILRAHRLAADLQPRDSARFSILAGEWPGVQERLRGLLERRTSHSQP
jgi:N-acetyltransferase